MIGRLDLELLTAFVAIVECGSFTRAAEQLNRTQSGVSMQIKRLEERVGRQLLHRHSRDLALTEDGRTLFNYARRIVDLEEEARARLSGPPLSGEVRIGLPEWFADKRLQRLLAQFTRAHPNIHLTVRTDASSNLRAATRSGELDLALAIFEPGKPNSEVLYREPLSWVVGEEFVLDVNECMPLALFEPPCPYREIATERLEAAGWQWREVLTSASVASVQTAVETGLGISVIPRSAITARMRVLGPDDGFAELPDTELGIHVTPRMQSLPASHLAACLEEALRGPALFPISHNAGNEGMARKRAAAK